MLENLVDIFSLILIEYSSIVIIYFIDRFIGSISALIFILAIVIACGAFVDPDNDKNRKLKIEVLLI